MTFEEYLGEAIKGWKSAHRDLARIRSNAASEGRNYILHQLKKDGKIESKMHDARTTYASEQEARDKAMLWQKLNPTSGLKYNLYDGGRLLGVI